jgi:Leucine-rich repeat (LRR) protein
MPHSLEHISPGELINLESLNLSSNEFCSAELCALSSLRELKVLEISGNNIIELPEQFKLPALRLLDLRENPICNKPDYRQDMLARLPELRFLDDALVKRGSPETQQADYPNVSLKNPHATYDAEKMNELRQIQKQYYAETC